MSETVIIGAGITGISFARHYKKPCVILEKEKKAGGLCATENTGGYYFDYSGHFLHLRNSEVKNLITKIMKGNLLTVKRDARIFSHNALIRYPFQANLYNLPLEVKRECVLDFVAKPELGKTKHDFYSWLISTFGKGITKYFMRPYNEKLWTVSCDKLTTEWVAPFVPTPALSDVITGALTDNDKAFGYNAEFFYPKKGGCQAFIDALKDGLNNIKYSTECSRVDIKKRVIETTDGKTYSFDKLVSTQPLPKLLEQISDLPANVALAKDNLDWNKVLNLNLGIKRGKGKAKLASGMNWVYFPSKDYPFYRAGVYTNAAPQMAQEGRDSLYVEFSRRPGDAIFPQVSAVVAKLRHCGILDDSDKVETSSWFEMPFAYVIYDSYRTPALRVIKSFLEKNGIYSIGRDGAWKYSFMEESILDAKKLAREI